MLQVASEKEIKAGKVSDVYFSRAVEVLRAKGIDKYVKAEIRAHHLPGDWDWAVLAGIEEASHFLKGVKVKVLAMEEGTVFHAGEPVLLIQGNYLRFATAETSLLGLLCQASGIATKAARCKKSAHHRQVISFGARRMHPALAPMIERNAFIGGCDGVAVIKSAELIGEEPIGTMPHSLVLLVGDSVEAFKLFHEIISPRVERVALVDTFIDEKFEAIRVAEAMGKNLFAVRLDTPGSRRGNMKEILEEVRWELDLRGFKEIKLFVTGGVDEYEIAELNSLADAYGIGTSISNAPVINFALDIVEIEGKPLAKRGKKSGGKQVWRCRRCSQTLVLPQKDKRKSCECQGGLSSLLKPLMENGKVVRDLPRPQAIRKYVLGQLQKVELDI
ncbi:nicotinate phosphoribosyltransferase [candidate division NPL-UPA2 bacterium]|nr:nicotinate phosphoribosyltransferase [candidate division NPL-UPA2 bacterium]